MHGHSLVELTGYDNSADDIMVHTCSTFVCIVCTATTYLQQSMDQPHKVAKPARGQLNREIKCPCRCTSSVVVRTHYLLLFAFGLHIILYGYVYIRARSLYIVSTNKAEYQVSVKHTMFCCFFSVLIHLASRD